ncbi:MAG: CRTAC1 family protein [Myxococcota bacterium]
MTHHPLHILLCLALSAALFGATCSTPEQDNTATPSTPAGEATDTLRTGPYAEGFFSARSDRIRDNPARRRYGVAVSDLDGDGDVEAIVAGYGGANEVLDWQQGALVDIAPPEVADSGRKAIGVAACDVNGDGREDIYLLNIDRFGGLGEVSDRLLVWSKGGWQDLFELPQNAGRTNRFAGRSVACLDRDGDGRYGVFVANYGGPMKLFEVDDDQRLTDVGPEAGIALITGGRSLLTLPLEGRPGMHMFAGNENGPNFLFQNQGDGTFQEVAATAGVADPMETVRGVTTLDADGDGDFDLLYGNWEGPHRLFVAEDGLVFQDRTPGAMRTPSRIRTVIAADFDNDGVEELFWNNIGQPNRLFGWRRGAWVELPIGDALEPNGLGTGGAVGDFDGDGLLDLLVSHGESGPQPLSLYVTKPNGNHWLRVAPRTAQGGPARGALVTLTDATGRTQRRMVDAGSGYLCQMEPVAHFGLGTTTEVTSIEVRWPSGDVKRVERPAIDHMLIVQP